MAQSKPIDYNSGPPWTAPANVPTMTQPPAPTPYTKPSERLLSISDHDRDAAGLLYVYPVVSRRAGGVSVGINLNPNNACNWACVYCQVPGLTRGGPPPIDLGRLEREFTAFLGEILDGDYLTRHVPETSRRLADVAFSGNGEPTAAAEFEAAVRIVAGELARRNLTASVPIRVITNGSLVHRPAVQRGLQLVGSHHGEIWFKVDRATAEGIRAVNQVQDSPARVMARLRRCASLAPTWLQTCWFGIDGTAPSAAEVNAYLAFAREAAASIRGIHLYGVARTPMQPDAARITRLPTETLEALARQLNAAGIRVTVNP